MTCGLRTWGDLRLPPPDVGSRYRIGLGLVRTRFRDGGVRQRRRYTHWPRQWRLEWTLSADQWHTMSAFLAEYGSDYFAMPLVSGEDGAGAVSAHNVRMIGDVDVSGIAQGALRVRLDVEQASGMTPASTAGWEWPCAMLESYSYGEKYGIARTPFDAPITRQQRQYTTRPRLFQVRWRLSYADLAIAEAWLNQYGSAYNTLQLLSGASAMLEANSHTVRLAGDPAVTYQGSHADLTLTLEEACADDSAALSEINSRVLTCTDSLTTTVPLGLDAAGFAAAWGDSTDWGRTNP